MSAARNLKPWKPGQSGNPSGMPRIPDALRGIHSLTQLEVVKVVSKYARMTREELQRAITATDIPMLELAVASVFAQSAKRGDYQRLAFLLDRAIGKPKEVVEDTESKLAGMNDAELMAHVEQIIAARKQSA
jgi:hypothetical protein